MFVRSGVYQTQSSATARTILTEEHVFKSCSVGEKLNIDMTLFKLIPEHCKEVKKKKKKQTRSQEEISDPVSLLKNKECLKPGVQKVHV